MAVKTFSQRLKHGINLFIKAGPMVVLMLALATAAAFADSLAIDFESPTYTTGNIHGQDGWSKTGAYDVEVVTNSYGYGTFGGQSLRISSAVASGSFGDHTFSKSLVDEAGESTGSDAYNGGMSGGTRQPYFEAEWDFASTVPGSEQPGLSVVASPDRGDGARMSWVQMVDTPTGLAINFNDYQISASPPTGAFVQTNIASDLDRTVPHTIRIRMYFVDGPENDVVQVYVDGVLAHTGTSWEDFFRQNQPPGTRTVDSILFRTSVAAPATAGNGLLIDNLTLFSGPTPPPPPPDCTGTSDCYVDDDGNDANGGASFADPKKTIQAGINAVAAGGTVHVAPGTYNESPNINKSLTLESSTGRDVTIIQLQSGPTYLGALTIDGATVTVDGFTIEGFDAVGTGLANSNILVTNSPDTVVIENNRIQVGNIGSGSNGDDGIGLLTTYSETSDVDSLTVTDNIFEPLNSVGSRAFYVNPGVNDFVFQGNEINGQFNGTAITQAKDGLVEENTVTGSGAAGSRSAGLGAWGYPDPTVYGQTVFRKNTLNGTRGISIFEAEDVTVENNFLSNNDYGVSVRTVIPLAFDVSTIHINGNSITNSHFFGVYKDVSVTGLVDASANWWGVNTSTGVAAEVSADVDYTPWLNASTDTSADPGFQGDFSYLHVDDDSPQTGSVMRIQEGVNTVSGSTVHVVAGTYVEQVVITIDLTLFGDGAASTFIQAPATLPAAVNANSTIIDINGSGVEVDISEFTIMGPGPSSCGSIGAGIFVRGSAYANIHDNHILDIRDDEPGPTAPFSGCQNGVGIVVGRVSFSATGTADINNNLIKGYQKNAIVVSNVGSSANVINNVVTGFGAQTEIAQNGIQISGGAIGTVTANIVKDHLCDHASCGSDPVNGVQSAGILLFDPGAGTVVSGNTISNNDMGVYNYVDTGGAPMINGNTLIGNRYEGIFLDQGNATVSNNELSGTSNIGIAVVSFDAAVYFTTANSNGTVTNNKIKDTGAAIKLIDETTADAFIPTITAHLNSITGNTTGLNNTTTGGIDVEKNWWASATGPTNVSNPGGTGQSVVGPADFDPWLCDGTDTQPVVIGFQPNLTTSPCVGPQGTIIIKKDTVPNDAQDFGFSGTSPIGNFSLDDDSNGTLPNQRSFVVNAGTYTVTESNAAGFNLTNLVCSDANSTEDIGTRTATIQLEGGETVTCTFTNTKVNPKIVVDKKTPVIANGGGPLTYTYKVTNPGNVPLHTVTVSDDKCAPVLYQSGDDGDNLLEPGETWTFTCTYTPAFSSYKLTNKATAKGKYGSNTYYATDTETLYPFTLKKKIYLYWENPSYWHSAYSVPYSPTDNTAFTVQVYKNNTLVGTYTISQNAPRKLWLSDGTYTFKEVNLPAGYVAVDAWFTYTTSDGHGYHYCNFDRGVHDDNKNIKEWTFRNVIKSNLAIDKTGPTTARKNTTVTYTYKVTNSGPASVRPKVSDDKCSAVSYVSGDTDHDGRVDPGETWIFKCSYKVTASVGSYITNKATVSDLDQPYKWNFGGDTDTSNNKDTWTLKVVP